jgi:DNA-nicking Smr family endonuclease
MASWVQSLREGIRTLLGLTPSLDLHGCGVTEALQEIEAFLRHAQRCGIPVVRIIYGKGHGSPGGRGVLREVVPRWLEQRGAELITGYRRLPDATGGDGAVEVSLRLAEQPPFT